MNTAELQNLKDWLIDGARSAASPAQVMAEICERLVSGRPAAVARRRFHPDPASRYLRPQFHLEARRRGRGRHGRFQHSGYAGISHQPALDRVHARTEVRARTDDPDSSRFPIVEEMRAEGVTEYVALPLPFTDGAVNASSWTTKQPGGFTDEQMNALRSVLPPLTRYVEIISLRRTAIDAARHLCRQPRRRKNLGGQIRRGHTETMNAAIWLSDLRGFTALSDRLPAETVVDILNQYFDCQVAAIRDHGGEVLKFMGDGLLAVFPIDEYVGDEQQVCCTRAGSRARSRAPASRRCSIRSATPSSAFASASRCMSGESSMAISAAATGSTSPASVLRSIWRRGWKRSPAGCNAPWWRRKALPASAAAAGSDLGEFPIAGFSKAERVFGLRTRRRRPKPDAAHSSGSVVNSSG